MEAILTSFCEVMDKHTSHLSSVLIRHLPAKQKVGPHLSPCLPPSSGPFQFLRPLRLLAVMLIDPLYAIQKGDQRWAKVYLNATEIPGAQRKTGMERACGSHLVSYGWPGAIATL